MLMHKKSDLGRFFLVLRSLCGLFDRCELDLLGELKLRP
jgi:hypothetical protein